MENTSNSLTLHNYFLQPGFVYMPVKPAIISTVVGSCVAVCVFDRKQKVGAMNHFQLPYIDDPQQATARYGNVSVSLLINMMIAEGSKASHLEAQIIGGAFHPDISQENIGQENIGIAKKIIEKKKISIVSEDVGGEKGRKIVFNIAMNEVAVVKVDNIRKADWYPYESVR